jgi:hypothetical protein
MPSQIQFFATRSDLLPILEAVEKDRQIKYVKFGASDSQNSVSFPNSTAIPDLGKASSESSISSATFLICERSEELRPRQVAGHRYVFDQLVNPKTITFTPGGLWDEILLNGRFATASTEVSSLGLLKLFQSLVRKRFEKIKAYYVGEEAAQMLDHGKRLTIGAQSARMFDLSRT